MSADVHAGQLPVGSGKSAVAEAIKLATGAHGVIPSNILIEQVIGTYPRANYLKGKSTYRCFSGLSCLDWTTTLKQRACHSCEFKACRDRASLGESTYFNPMSLHFYSIGNPGPFPVLVVDEAHQLPGMVSLLTSKRLRQSVYRWTDDCLSELRLIPWMKEQIRKLDKLANTYRQISAWSRLQPIVEEITTLGMTLAALEADPQNYAIYAEKSTYRGFPERYLLVRPVRSPPSTVRTLLNCDKLILLSGTLLPQDLDDLAAGRSSRSIDLPSPIPASRRPVLYRPATIPLNVNTDPVDLARQIERVLDLYPSLNTIIHVSYSLGKRLAPLFKRPILTNTAATKDETLARFKRDGGVWLACGCSEGLDLYDDICRLNIIPRLGFADMRDPVVAKRRALDDGTQWYELEALKIVVQRAGRSTRHEEDYSVTVVMDPLFSRLVRKYRHLLPRSFVEAIQWQL